METHFQLGVGIDHHQTLYLKPHHHMTLVPPFLRKLNLAAPWKDLPIVKLRRFSSLPVHTKPLARARTLTKPGAQELKDNWLKSLTCPLHNTPLLHESDGKAPDLTRLCNVRGLAQNNWVVGIDPDVSGAIALLKPGDASNLIPQVFDSPNLQVLVGKRARKRLDVNSIIQLLRSFEAPYGTKAYIEQSTPYPQDGKLGWWGGGFSYGLWIGVLVASGFSVVPVPSSSWKNEFKLSGNGVTKDDSRIAASSLFPSLSSSLKRKKDHGRAEALLIAAYGKELKLIST